MKKKFLSAFLCMGIVMSTFVGCKTTNKENNEKTTVASQTEETSARVTSESDATKDGETGNDSFKNDSINGDGTAIDGRYDGDGAAKDEAKNHETEASLMEYFNDYTFIKQQKKKESHYIFNMRAMNDLERECGIEDIEKYWNGFIDALLEGRTEFECPDKEVFSYIYYVLIPDNLPAVAEWLDMPWDQEVEDGTVHFTYKISTEELKEKIEIQKNETEKILNEVLEDDYSDFEKALALYIYFQDNFYYYEDYSEWGGVMHVLKTKSGICGEFAMTYTYLLTQAGVDAGTVTNNGHCWSIVRIKGKYYHIDTTWALGHTDLVHFMQTKSQKLDANNDGGDEDTIDCWMADFKASYGRYYPYNDFDDEDDSCAALWRYFSKVKWNREEKRLYIYSEYNDDGEYDPKITEFDYSKFE